MRQFYREDPERKRKIADAQRGERSHLWKGGVTALNDACYRGRDWKALAERARTRDGRCCRRCGKSEAENGRRLDVHHIVPFHNFPAAAAANRLENLESLCRACHRRAEREVDGAQCTLALSPRWRHRNGMRRGSHHHGAKLTETDVIAIRAAKAVGASLATLAAKYGVTKSAVAALVHRHTWRHVA